jgi:transposase
MAPQGGWCRVSQPGSHEHERRYDAVFGLDGFRVVRVDVCDENDPEAPREVLIEGVEHEQACPARGVLSSKVHARKVRRVKDVPHGRGPLRVRWDQRRWACRQQQCRRRTFAETSAQVGPRQRLTGRLREQLERAVSGSTRSAADVAREYDVSWWSVNTALVVVAAAMLPRPPCGVRLLGVDETRARSVRWLLAESGWRRSDPWMTSFVDLDPAHPGGLLGLAPGRSGASVRGWLGLQSEQFRDGIEVVAVDPSAPFAAALRDVLPSATLVVDHWHLHRLANLMLTQVRQRVTQQVHGHRGRASNDSWAYRRLLLRGARHLSDKQWRRLRTLLATDDPTCEIQAAWAGKELLRQLLDALPASSGPLVVDPRRDPAPASRPAAPGLRPHEVRARLARFYDLAARAQVPELERLASTIETWWPAIEAYLRLRVTTPEPRATTARSSRSSACRAASATRTPTNGASC